jgi:hypothetical protein
MAAKKKAKKKKKKTPRSTVTTRGKRTPVRKRARKRATPELKRARDLSGAQSGDLQGLSTVEGADSESVGELLEEGNPFEAGVVTGVEEAENADEREVKTHEVLEDDVPDEYLEKE